MKKIDGRSKAARAKKTGKLPPATGPTVTFRRPSFTRAAELNAAIKTANLNEYADSINTRLTNQVCKIAELKRTLDAINDSVVEMGQLLAGGN